MFQLRGSDGRAYRPGRDIAYMFRDIASYACHRLAQSSWHTAVRGYAAHTGLTEASLIDAAVALRKFYELSTNTDVRDLGTAWINAGLDAVPGPALLALFFELGVGWTAAWFNAVREITPAGQAANGLDKMADIADRAARAVKEGVAGRRAAAAEEIRNLADENGKEG